ncbi:MAG: alkylation response protein AidB-like acyl-CoA dehydrogenase [Paracoccaceae bacterium]|jgi:alkylation response protein AidB-like acyl-CoA dehydrogenase
MDLNYSPKEQSFQAEVQKWLSQNLSPELSNRVKRGQNLSRDDMQGWHDTLNARGWLANHWPVEHGGTGWTAIEKHIFEEECSLAYAPRIIPFGLSMLGPVLIKYGNETQIKHWLPRILNGADWWCQGYSEPGAGSDLASLRCKAERDGDHYIVNGQKTWTTLGQYANMIFMLVRTSNEGKPQQGISFLLIDMDTPGIEMRPIHLLEGTHEVNEVFFTDVRVPVENLVGEESKGWTYAKYLLTYERANIAGIGASMAELNELKVIVKDQKRGPRSLADDPLFAARMARAEIELENTRITNLRVVAAAAEGGMPGPETSMLKIKGTEIRQELDSLLRKSVGAYAAPLVPESFEPGFNGPYVGPDYAAPVATDYFNNRKITIFGGSNEIQKNIISKMILGL